MLSYDVCAMEPVVSNNSALLLSNNINLLKILCVGELRNDPVKIENPKIVWFIFSKDRNGCHLIVINLID